MGIISTGLGSVDDSISEMSQSFCLGTDATNLSFDYNVVSEEPMEFVGTEFDDKFQVVLIKDDDTEAEVAFESINTSSWIPIEGINFAGGDETTYMTGWEHIDVDISGYSKIKAIIFKVKTWDVGDSIYDTAALVDHIQLYNK